MKILPFRESFIQDFKAFFQLKPSPRSWHIPVLAGLSVGIPLLTGYYLGNVRNGLTASLAGLVILYMPISKNFFEIMTRMFICSFGLIVCYALGLVFSFNFLAAALFFGVLSVCAYFVTKYFNVKPPGSFFFIMIASMAVGLPHHLDLVPQRVGYFTLGILNANLLAFVYYFLVEQKKPVAMPFQYTNSFVGITESLIIGLFMMLSILVGHFLKLQYPYWIPISCLAVLQGVDSLHIWKRGLHRILGTLVGLGIAWFIFKYISDPLYICICIVVLQIIVELLIARHYALAVVFLTPMGILLAETGSSESLKPDELLTARLLEILIGSLLGCIGGWFLYNEKIRNGTISSLKKAHSKILRKK